MTIIFKDIKAPLKSGNLSHYELSWYIDDSNNIIHIIHIVIWGNCSIGVMLLDRFNIWRIEAYSAICCFYNVPVHFIFSNICLSISLPFAVSISACLRAASISFWTFSRSLIYVWVCSCFVFLCESNL